MSTKEIRQQLGQLFDTFSCRGGVYTIKKSYYWGFTEDGSALADKVKKKLPSADVLDYGNHWHPFVGGAKSGSSQDSYYYCKFKVA
jgi:hypothetical protein